MAKTRMERAKEVRWRFIADAILATGNPEEAAKYAKVTLGSVERCLESPAFQQFMTKMKEQRFRAAADKATASISDALQALHKTILSDESAYNRMMAARALLDFTLKAKGTDLEDRLNALESAAKSPTPKLKQKPAPAPLLVPTPVDTSQPANGQV